VKRKCFSIEQIVAVLKQAETGTSASDPIGPHRDCRVGVLPVTPCDKLLGVCVALMFPGRQQSREESPDLVGPSVPFPIYR
jgi:hypothetical protein